MSIPSPDLPDNQSLSLDSKNKNFTKVTSNLGTSTPVEFLGKNSLGLEWYQRENWSGGDNVKMLMMMTLLIVMFCAHASLQKLFASATKSPTYKNIFFAKYKSDKLIKV